MEQIANRDMVGAQSAAGSVHFTLKEVTVGTVNGNIASHNSFTTINISRARLIRLRARPRRSQGRQRWHGQRPQRRRFLYSNSLPEKEAPPGENAGRPPEEPVDERLRGEIASAKLVSNEMGILLEAMRRSNSMGKTVTKTHLPKALMISESTLTLVEKGHALVQRFTKANTPSFDPDVKRELETTRYPRPKGRVVEPSWEQCLKVISDSITCGDRGVVSALYHTKDLYDAFQNRESTVQILERIERLKREATEGKRRALEIQTRFPVVDALKKVTWWWAEMNEALGRTEQRVRSKQDEPRIMEPIQDLMYLGQRFRAYSSQMRDLQDQYPRV
ncbi:hypothetical protein C8J56DRAFT_915072 [Mycena floridula]|nr:hypothetical protein C8J56DRAFT_915072 [Mycena floridula]